MVDNLLSLPDFAMPSFGLGSFLDIALITFVVYRLLGWVRQTRAWGVFKGIAALLIIYLAAVLLGMYATVWLINQTITWAVIVLAILFQPELRKFLERLGKGRRIPFIGVLEADKTDDNSEERATIEEIIKAALEMAKTKTGALIVIEQETPLGDLETTGTVLDAVASSQLLLSIFENKAPMHDGAVLIRQNRVRAAACILPLTAENIARELGTRHRAAIGVTETSDAYALVVSEETGAISIAKEGKLYRSLSEIEMRNMLLSNIRPSKSRKKKDKKKK